MWSLLLQLIVMLFIRQQIAQLLLFLSVPVIIAPTLVEAKNNIIYEYDVITQKKGQTFQDALQKVTLSGYQKNLLLALPILQKAKSDRKFRITYAVRGNKRLMREVKVTRGDRMANFVLEGEQGHHKFVSKASQIGNKQLKLLSIEAQKPSEPASNEPTNDVESLLAAPDELFSLTAEQQKGQELAQVLKTLNLSQTQLEIINSGKFLKSALSQRKLTLYFVGSKQHKLLRGITITRGQRRVDYMVVKKDKNFLLENLRVLGEETRSTTLDKFSKAKHQGHAVSPTVTSVDSNNQIIDSGSFKLYRVVQKKGQSLDAAMKGFTLSRIQRQLLNAVPVVEQAKSTRFFYPLFEKQGNNKYLKAVRVVRGKNVAEFVLVKYKGKWIWADKRGKVSSGRDAFLRYPLNFRRVSSAFNLRRRHPITRRIRPHKGTDFSAPHGTPIWAPANGVVTFSGRQRGFGIVLVIDHGNGYKTKYAHLSRIMKNARKGRYVKKRQIVARVGNTGRSTGSHLHYEVHVNGRPRNPMTVRLPGGKDSISLTAAKAATAKYLPQIKRML